MCKGLPPRCVDSDTVQCCPPRIQALCLALHKCSIKLPIEGWRDGSVGEASVVLA